MACPACGKGCSHCGGGVITINLRGCFVGQSKADIGRWLEESLRAKSLGLDPTPEG